MMTELTVDDYSESPDTRNRRLAPDVAVESIVTNEVDEFGSAVAGLTVDYLRTNRGSGPLSAMSIATGDLAMTTGAMGFGAVAHAVVPADAYVFAAIHEAAPGTSWNGEQLRAGDVAMLPPSSHVVGSEPEGLHITLWVAPAAEIHEIVADLGRDKPSTSSQVHRLSGRSGFLDLCRIKNDVVRTPALLNSPSHRATVLEGLVRSVSGVAPERGQRRSSSRKLVGRCIDEAVRTRASAPSMSMLCRAAMASESRVRAAFVEVTGLPPTLYFQRRLLKTARQCLIEADPVDDTVTTILVDLGVTQFGRFAGRYSRVFGEMPSDTLRQSPMSLQASFVSQCESPHEPRGADERGRHS